MKPQQGGQSSEECLRRCCPCLDSLWNRIFKEKPPAEDVEERDPVSEVPEVPVEEEGVPELHSPPPLPPKPPKKTTCSTGSIFTALWSFEAGHPDELSFQDGDLFTVLDRSGDWWQARKIDSKGRVLSAGIVPGNYLTRAETHQEQRWFHGTMNRFDAKGHLMGPGNSEGAFLIRQSERDGVGYVLSVRSGNGVKHFKIHQTSQENFYVEPNHHFDSLISLVEHYSNNSLNNMGKLGHSCKKREPSRTDLSHTTVDDWKLPKDEFTLGEQLGSGYFSEVYSGRWKNLVNVAIKVLKNDSEMNHQAFHKEVLMLKNLHHRYLISLFAICTDSTPYYIVTELMEKGSLLTFLRSSEGHLQDLSALIDMSVQVAEAMAYLEKHNSIHRDLAARNVLVGADYICKVGDFGLARIIKEPIYVTDDKKMPYKWCAPEAISHGEFSSKSDVWSFGILLYEIITYGGNPYPAFDSSEVYQQLLSGYRMPIPPKCPDFFYKIMLRCWEAKPEDRPNFMSLQKQLNSNSYDC